MGDSFTVSSFLINSALTTKKCKKKKSNLNKVTDGSRCVFILGGEGPEGGTLLDYLTYSPVFDEIAEDRCSNVQAIENRIS